MSQWHIHSHNWYYWGLKLHLGCAQSPRQQPVMLVQGKEFLEEHLIWCWESWGEGRTWRRGEFQAKGHTGTLDTAAPKGVFKPLAHHSNEGWVQQDTVYRGWTQTSREEQDVLQHWWTGNGQSWRKGSLGSFLRLLSLKEVLASRLNSHPTHLHLCCSMKVTLGWEMVNRACMPSFPKA